MTSTYKFAGFTIRCHGAWLNRSEGLACFRCEETQACDLELSAEPVDDLPLAEDALFKGMVSHEPLQDGVAFGLNEPGIRCHARLFLNREMTIGRLAYLAEEFVEEPGGAELLIEHVVHLRMLRRGSVFLHSAGISYRGGAILFTAPSGTGKTTQAERWRSQRGAEIINGDRPVLVPRDGGWFACGTPWSGSSGNHTTLEVPVKCVVVVLRAPENRVTALTAFQAVPRVLPRLFLPYAGSEGMAEALDLASRLCEEVPMFELACRPDSEAVDVLWEGIRFLWPDAK